MPSWVHTREGALDAIKTVLQEIGLSYIDLILIHTPMSAAEDLAVWEGLADAKAAGLVRHIGVSNFPRPAILRHSPRQAEDGLRRTSSNSTHG